MAQTSGIAAAQHRDFYFYSLYRVLEAGLLALLLFGPVRELLPAPLHPLLGKVTSFVYLAASALLMFWALRRVALRWQVLAGIVIDVAAGTLAIHAMPSAASGIALMLVFNVGATALLLPLRYGLAGGALAGAAMIAEYIWSTLAAPATGRPMAEPLMFAVSFLSIAMLTHLLGRQVRESQALADRRGGELADLAAVNELIIRRMRTGVLLVDGNGAIRLANEAAMLQLGDRGGDRRLADVSPALAGRLDEWRRTGASNEIPLRIGEEQPEVLPRFARLLAHGDNALVFLDDTTLVSRRAESMTLATLGRFSASLAHEIRNPLAAINYAAQLLQESGDVTNIADQRLLQIIHAQCQRTNGIVENVLALARRERASADNVDLTAFTRRFVDDYRQVLPPESSSVEVRDTGEVHALVDPRHLQQVLTVLLHNALTHGHLPGDPAQVRLDVYVAAGRPTIDVRDHGPGIPAETRGHLFRPFFTTAELGTGLGLYIARELCRANEATLDYIDLPDSSSCFRIVLPDPHALLPA